MRNCASTGTCPASPTAFEGEVMLAGSMPTVPYPPHAYALPPSPLLANLTEKHHVGEEITDCLVYLLRLADVLDVDLPAAVSQKMDKNRSKYPVSAVLQASVGWGIPPSQPPPPRLPHLPCASLPDAVAAAEWRAHLF